MIKNEMILRYFFLSFVTLSLIISCTAKESHRDHFGKAAHKEKIESLDGKKESIKDDISLPHAAAFYANVAKHVQENYVEKIKNETLLDGALKGMLTALDPHSSYLNKKEYHELRYQTQGEYGGLGFEVTMEGGLVKIISPLDDTPASKAGLQPGDLIVGINRKAVFGLSLIEAVDKLKGKPGTQVDVTIRRDKKNDFNVTLTRKIIKIQPVKSKIEHDVGYIRIRTFNEATTLKVKEAVLNIKKELTNKLQGVILDLRNNPGGLFDQAVGVSDLFLEEGIIVSIKPRRGEKAQHIRATPGDILDGIPIAVLINGGSASSSEIVAAALKEQKRGIILGTRSYGKGSVQTVIPLANKGAIMLTTALYHTPSGISIQKKGVMPNIEIEQAIDVTLLNEDERFRESNFGSALEPGKHLNKKDPSLEEKDKKPENLEKKKADETVDYQYLRALDVLRGINFYKQGHLRN